VLSELKDFLTTANEVSSVIDPDPANTGGGNVTGVTAEDDAPSETWTLTCTAGGVTGTFSVTGSVSGAQAAATVGTPYDNNIVAFTINDGTPDFVIGDNFTFTVTQIMGDEKWTTQRHTVDYNGEGDDELIILGPGSAGDATDEVCVGIRTYRDTTEGYYNWELNGYTGYVAPSDFYSQPGSIGATRSLLPQVLLDDGITRYWFVANGRRVAGCLKVSGIYAPFYLGLILPYGTPNAFPYPLVIGGSAVYDDYSVEYLKHSSTRYTHRGFPDPYSVDTATGISSCRLLNGSWVSFGNWTSDAVGERTNIIWPKIYAEEYIHPYTPNKIIDYAERNVDNTYPMFPLILAASSPRNNIFGEFQGCFAVFGNGMYSEDDITYGGGTYKIFQNCFRIGAKDFWALKLE
jgi:hypothetical protein